MSCLQTAPARATTGFCSASLRAALAGGSLLALRRRALDSLGAPPALIPSSRLSAPAAAPCVGDRQCHYPSLRIRVSQPHCPLITSVRTSPCVAAQGWLNARSCSIALPVSLSADYALLPSEGTAAPSLLVPGAGAAGAAAAAMAAVAFQQCADDDSGPRIPGVKKRRDVLLS